MGCSHMELAGSSILPSIVYNFIPISVMGDVIEHKYYIYDPPSIVLF